MGEQNIQFHPELKRVNRKIVFCITIFVIFLAVYGFLSYGNAYFEYALVKDVLGLVFKDLKIINIIVSYINVFFSLGIIISFISSIYFLNEKAKIKKKYQLKGGDEVDFSIRSIFEKYLGEKKK